MLFDKVLNLLWTHFKRVVTKFVTKILLWNVGLETGSTSTVNRKKFCFSHVRRRYQESKTFWSLNSIIWIPLTGSHPATRICLETRLQAKLFVFRMCEKLSDAFLIPSKTFWNLNSIIWIPLTGSQPATRICLDRPKFATKHFYWSFSLT